MGVWFRGFWIFQASREEFSRIWISDFFRGFHVQYLKVTKNGSHLVVFVTLFATNFVEVQQYKKARSELLRDFCWREFVFTGTDHERMRTPFILLP